METGNKEEQKTLTPAQLKKLEAQQKKGQEKAVVQKTVVMNPQVEEPATAAGEKIAAGPELITMHRSLNTSIQNMDNINKQYGEHSAIVEGLKPQIVQARQTVIMMQQQLRAVLDQEYGQGSMIGEDGVSIVIPQKQEMSHDQNPTK